jgi:hypothetical protein
MLHWSARQRWEETKIGPRRQRYQPLNPIAALESVRRGVTKIVGLDGEPFAGTHAGNGAQTSRDVEPPAARPAANGAGLGEATRESAERSNGDARANQAPSPLGEHVR